jgi:hypothetical protein
MERQEEVAALPVKTLQSFFSLSSDFTHSSRIVGQVERVWKDANPLHPVVFVGVENLRP